MKQKTNRDLQVSICSIMYSIVPVRWDFEEYIKDQDIPLTERWELFKWAPNWLKGTLSNIIGMDEIMGNRDLVMYEGPIHAERYQTMEFATIIESLEENYEPGEVEAKYNVRIDDIKERILAANVATFVYDW